MINLTLMNHIGIYLILSMLLCLHFYFDKEFREEQETNNILIPLSVSLFIFLIIEAVYFIIKVFFINA